ncbi:hypothetical protein [Ferruginibacter sp.]
MLFLFIALSNWSKAQNGVSLVFNHNGNLISTLPDTITGIKEFIIQMPVKLYTKEKKNIEEKRESVKNQIIDASSFFYKCLIQGKTSDSGRIRKLYTDDSGKYSFQSEDVRLNKAEAEGSRLFPPKFIDHYTLLNRMLQLTDGTGIIAGENTMLPYSVTIGKGKKQLKCVCIKKQKETFDFYFTNTEPVNTDGSFTYTITYTDILQKLTLNHLNDVYGRNDSTIRILNLIDAFFSGEVKKIADSINATVDSIALLAEFPEGSQLREGKEIGLWKKYNGLKQRLIYKIGDVAKDSTLFQTSLILQQWIFKWAWLTGGTGILNPFKFTSGNKIGINSIDSDSLKVKEIFYSRLLDSLKSFADLAKMEDLVNAKMEALVNYKQRIKNNNNEVTRNKNRQAENDKLIDKLAYTGITLYAGTIFTGNRHNITRNYYFDNDIKANKNKFKFKYPDDDSVYLLYHNVPSGTLMEIQGNYKPFDDTPDFTKFLSKAIDTLGGLYSLVSGASGNFTKILNNLSTNGTRKYTAPAYETANNPFAIFETVINPGFAESNFEYKRSINITRYAKSLSNDTVNQARSIQNKDFIERLQHSKKSFIDTVKQDMKNGDLKSENNNQLKIVLDNSQGNREKLQIKNRFINVFNNNKEIKEIFENRINILPSTLLPVDYQDTLFKIFDEINALIIRANTISITERNYYKFLSKIVTSAPMPLEGFSVEEKTDTTPKYKTQAFVPDAKEAPYKFEYSFTKVIKSDTAKTGYLKFKTDSSYFNIGKRYRFQLAAGLAYSFAPIVRTNIDTSKNSFSVNKDENKMRIIAGVRFYLGKGIYQHDNRFIPRGKLGWLDKTSIMVGVGIPKPLDNYYIGAGYDIVPGFNINLGGHFYRYINYNIANNTIVDNSSILKVNSYVAITVDPTLFVKFFKTL